MSNQTLIDALNNDLANEFQAIVMYTTYSAQVKGPFRLELVNFFQGEIPDEQGHALFLSNKIVSLGGVPTTTPAPVAAAETPKEMLENVLTAEKKAIEGYSKRAEQAREAGEIGLSVQLEDMIVDETGHYEETKKLLEEWF
ncbi:MAG: ferritin-like domain-containing protein [Anaerolineae bacterium]|nr:ferritin-like domain-containing protein [Anaerolineae bacterium]